MDADPVSRRTGPGGRLRPAPRPHRPMGTRLDTAAPTMPPPMIPRLGGLPGRFDGPGMHELDRSTRLDDLVEVDVELDVEIEADLGGEAPPAMPGRGLEAAAAQGNEIAGYGAPDHRADAVDTNRAPEPEADAPETTAVAAAEIDPSASVPSHPVAPTQAFVPRPEHRPAPDRPGPRPHEPVDRRPRPRPDHRAPSDSTMAAEEARPEGFVQERSEAPVCTAPQLRRFIKSRSYVPMHELRRRFAIEGEDDDVSPLEVAAGRVFVGLPTFESRLLADLVRNGEIGYELSLDPESPIVVGVYAMRPISRN